MKENHYKGVQSAILRGSGLVILFMIMSVLVISCDENNTDSGSLRAVLSVRESPNVPGRIEFDPRGSKPGAGQKLESHTIEVIDQDTGETVFGPVTESANSDSALKKAHFPSGDYLAILTVTATTISPDGDTDVRGTEEQITDTDEKEFSADTNIAFPRAGSCEATCSSSFIPDQTTVFPITVCSLPTGCSSLDLEEDVLNQAQSIDSGINEDTKMWIQAYGASGGNGTSPDIGGDGGKAGAGGFAQTIVTVAGFDIKFGATTIFYYLGEAGKHDDSGGTGGASTIVTTALPQTSNPITLDTLLLIAGGGGGGEGGSFDSDGTDGGGGGFASSTGVRSDTGIGSDGGSDNNDDFSPGLGGGGTICSEGIACGGKGGTNAKDGKQGFGGESGGSDNDSPGPRKWINGSPELENDAGKGGEGYDEVNCAGGGGGGGFGGGGGGGEGGSGVCSGGGGGGSYAAASTTTDSDAPSTNPNNSGDGEVIITFNPNP